MKIQNETRRIVVCMLARSLDELTARKLMTWTATDHWLAGPPVTVTLSQILEELIYRFSYSEEEAQNALVEAALDIADGLDDDQLDELEWNLNDDLKPLFADIERNVDTRRLAS